MERQGKNARLDRRSLLAAAGSALTGLACLPAGATEPRGLSLGQLAARKRLIFGASIAAEALADPAYGALYARETRLVVTDLALKFAILRPTRDRTDFGPADALLEFARRHGLMFRGHTLIWNEGNPDWLKGLSSREIAREFESHLETVAARYAGKVQSWDVVNEPFWPDHGAEGGFRRGPWFDALGPDYVARAFRRVAAIDKTALLMLNEAHAEHDDRTGRTIRRNLLRLIDTLLDAGVPLQGIGLQSHLRPQVPRDREDFSRFLQALGERRLVVYISELDVDDGPFPDEIATRDAGVAQLYETYLTDVLRHDCVKAIILWQLSDRYSWYRDPETLRQLKRTRAPRPLPFDGAFADKPAVRAIARAIETRKV